MTLRPVDVAAGAAAAAGRAERGDEGRRNNGSLPAADREEAERRAALALGDEAVQLEHAAGAARELVARERVVDGGDAAHAAVEPAERHV